MNDDNQQPDVISEDHQPQPQSQQVSRPTGKVFDVMRPGQAPAHPSSRPTIIGHIPQVQNTMIGGVSSPVRFATNPVEEDRPLMDSRQRVALDPNASTLIPPLAVDPFPTSSVATPTVPAPTAALDQDLAVDPQHLLADAPAEGLLPAGDITMPQPYQEQAQPQQPQPEAQPEAQPQSQPYQEQFRRETIAEADAKVPMSALPPDLLAQAQRETEPNTLPLLLRDGVTVSHHKRGKASSISAIIVTVVLIIVLGAIAGNFLLDAQVIKIDAIPHTHFLKKQ